MARASLIPFRSGGLFGADPFSALHRDVNRLFDEVMRGTSLAAAGQGQGGMSSVIAPQMNVSETDNEIRVTAELPGVSEQDIQVDLNDDLLTIRGEKKLERKEDKENFHFVERSYGTFQRSLQLPFPTDPGKVQARFENGVLTVTLPKAAQQNRSRRIAVSGPGTNGGASRGAKEQGEASATGRPASPGQGSESGAKKQA
ncbi:Hsp20/alpha crystallin family protein [Enterovirga sp. CN4-39]|uniref:Hsp20/alpha crystallin family protein n=1 Tax=Enterovirga sp. CN4-39 TaxID=3400910 RepID=UPI003BFEC23F